MNKKEFIRRVAVKSGITEGTAAQVVNAMISTVEDVLAHGGSVKLTGFGAFEVRERAARVGKNPRTGEAIQIAATKYPAFAAGKTLKDKVNGR